jgi:hypothetical protein
MQRNCEAKSIDLDLLYNAQYAGRTQRFIYRAIDSGRLLSCPSLSLLFVPSVLQCLALVLRFALRLSSVWADSRRRLQLQPSIIDSSSTRTPYLIMGEGDSNMLQTTLSMGQKFGKYVSDGVPRDERHRRARGRRRCRTTSYADISQDTITATCMHLLTHLR